MANNNYTPVTNAWQGYAYTLGAMDVYSHTFKSVSSNVQRIYEHWETMILALVKNRLKGSYD